MRVCVDIDGVLFPWERLARIALEARFGRVLPPSGTWDAIKNQVERHEWHWLWSREGQDAVFSRVEQAYMAEVLAVGDLLQDGHEVHFVTHRSPRLTLRHTARFLEHHFGNTPDWGGVHSITNLTPKISLAPWGMMIDDKPGIALGVAARETTMVFAPLRPWNVDELKGGEGPFLQTYYDPQDFVRWAAGR